MAEPPTKRIRLAYHHRHQLHHKPQKLPPHEPSVLPDESINKLLVDSIKTICEEEALRLGIYNPVVESVVLESLHNAAEEFTFKLCSKVRRSMFAARRTAPIATDFESAIDILSIPRPDDQLPPCRTSHEVNPPLLPTPPPEDPFHNHVELDAQFLGPDLSKQDDLQNLTFNAASLPPLPSAHTYKDSAVYTQRETDSRKLRELATEEGKLGEQALRKLAGAVKFDTALSTGPGSHIARGARGLQRRKPVLTEEAVFEETMRDLLRNEPGDFELGPVVTSERAYRMPDDAQTKRKVATVSKSSSGKLISSKEEQVNKYNLLPPPLPRKQSSAAARPSDDMDVSFEL